MRRAATSVFLAGWIGFLLVSAVTASLAVLRLAAFSVPSIAGLSGRVAELADRLLAGGNAAILAATVGALVAFVIAGLLGAALRLVHGASADDQATGEMLAMTGLALMGALVLVVDLCGFDLLADVGSLLGFETVVVLSMLAIAFDRLIAVEEEGEEDDAGFRAALTMIGQEMARDPNAPNRRTGNRPTGGRKS